MAFSDDLKTDLDNFLNTSEFAIDVSYKGATIKGIYDNNFAGVELDTASIESTQPQVVVKDDDIVGLLHGEKLTIKNIDYYVIGIQPDGTGISVILLSQDTE